MIELLIAACLVSASGECRNFSLNYPVDDMSLIACAVHGQQQIAEWRRTHPAWRVARWSCGYRPAGSRDI